MQLEPSPPYRERDHDNEENKLGKLQWYASTLLSQLNSSDLSPAVAAMVYMLILLQTTADQQKSLARVSTSMIPA
jgi:hypothetical protein